MVSVIVPIYNAEKRLGLCLDSIIGQTYKDLEIFLIDDGSIDSSGKICDDYASKDSRIKVYHLKNGGVSKARNYALKQITGEYVQFVDSDDILTYNAIESKLKLIENESIDLVVTDYIRDCNGSIKVIGYNFYGRKTLEDYVTYFVGEKAQSYYFGVLWNKLYSTEIIKENNIEFLENLSFAEDFIFNLEYLKHTIKIYVSDIPTYQYYINLNSESLSKSDEIYENAWHVRKDILYKSYVDFFKYVNLYNKYNNMVYEYLINSFSVSIHDLYKGNKKMKYVAKAIKTRRNDNEIQDVISKFIPRTKKQKIVVFLIRQKYDHLATFMYWCHSKIKESL